MSRIERVVAQTGRIFAVLLLATGSALAAEPANMIEQTLQNISALVRPGKVGYATVWDGNRFVQCRRLPDRALRCEAAGTALQPSLKTVLSGERLNRLAALGWTVDPAFGNFVQVFPSNLATSAVADTILKTLTEGYGAEPVNMEFGTAWIADLLCPPRNGPSQNLAGMINDAHEMRSHAIVTCSYKPPMEPSQKVASAAELIALSGPEVAAEIQRLRINVGKKIFVVLDVGIGYVQCAPDTSAKAFYCEAQSAESWAALTAVLTPERVGKLHALAYADPGRAPNYWKFYPFDTASDATVAHELLTILFDVYGYTGVEKFKVLTEKN